MPCSSILNRKAVLYNYTRVRKECFILRVQFYSRPNCPLCEEARLILRMVEEDVQLEIEYINIEDDENIHEKYLLRIPVIISNGKVIQEGRIDYPTLLEAFSL